MSDKNPETVILSHEEIYRGKIVTLQVDMVQQASGRSTIREVVLHPGGVTAIPVLKDGRLLLIRQFRYPIGKFILELPAGKHRVHAVSEMGLEKNFFMMVAPGVEGPTKKLTW